MLVAYSVLSGPDSVWARSTAFLHQSSALVYLPTLMRVVVCRHAWLSASDCAKAGAAAQIAASSGSINRKRRMLPPKAQPDVDPNTSGLSFEGQWNAVGDFWN